ncbi:MAG: NAD(P)H-dependent oxidoreductase [Planctomycetes bacterium]|nr:NAD(P)H-dependent oxidoreductase [Planctomycetota bacterium]
MHQLILSCSLSKTSKSAVLAQHLCDAVTSIGDDCTLMDLRKIELPFCDAASCYEHPNVKKIQQAIADADAVTIATPIYNYETGGATRNLIALTGQAWLGKTVGFICAAGGQGSYMAVMSLTNSLMLDFRCLIVPRFVYATGASFTDGNLTDDDVASRVKELAQELHRIATALPADTLPKT